MNVEKLLRKKQRAISENHTQNLAIACHNLGNWYQDKQNFDQALTHYKDEAEAYERLEKPLEKSRAHRMIGEMYMLLEDFDTALKHELIYLKTAIELNNKIEEQRAYATIGRVHLLKAQSNSIAQNKVELMKPIKSAEKAFLKSLLICKSLTDQPKLELLDMTARLYLNLGVTCECKEDYGEAIKHLEKAMTISRHNDFWELLHQCYTTTGILYFTKLNDFTKSLRLLNLAIRTAERLSTNRTVRLCQTLYSKSEVLIKMSDFQGAKQVLHKAYKLKTTDESDRQSIEKNLKIVAAICKAEDSLVAIESENFSQKKRYYEIMGDGACRLKNFSAAIGYYIKMLDAAEKNNENGKYLIPIYVSLYQTYKDTKDYSLALEFMWKEYDLCKDIPSEAFSTLFGIADTYQLAGKDFWEIDGIYERAKKEAKAMDNKKKEKAVLIEQVALREKHGMETLAALLREEAQSAGFKLTTKDESHDYDSYVESASEEINTPEVGDDICLDDLSDSASENEEIELQSVNQPRALRKRGCITIKRNEKGETQLHRACITGNTSMVRRLLDQGHAVNVRDHAGWLPLHEAANHGFKEIVELLLDNGASINDKGGTNCDGFTPIHDACGNGLLEIVELLLDRGANATLRNDLGNTPLQTLEIWRKGIVLDATEQSFYETVYSRLKQKLDKAGIFSVTESPAKLNNKRQSKDKSITPRKRILSDSTSSDDERSYRVINSEEIETVDNILDEAFPDAELIENVSQDLESSPSSSPEYQVDYREVMSDVRKGNFQNKFDSIASTFRPIEKVTKRPGMLATNEISSDDWLDNDLGPSKKKRRFLCDRAFSSDSNISAQRRNSIKSNQMSTSLPYDSSITSTNDNNIIVNDDDEDDENSMDAFNVLMSSSGSNSRRKKRLSSSNSNRSMADNVTRQQSSLLESGFSRYRVKTPDLSQPSVSSTVISPYKHSTTPPIPSFSIKVKVEQDLLNVPVNRNNADDLTIEWLAQEAAKRYYNLKGVKPILRLTTADGAIFENSDPLSLVFGENGAIASEVLEWNMPPLAQRYMEACLQTKIDTDPYIQTQLELITSTQALTINNQILTPTLSRPLFKSLHFQSNLTHLNFSNSFIEDNGIKFLAHALPTMAQLITLNLSGNLITSVGIKYLSCIFESNANVLPELSALVLSFNPLQNQSLCPLSKLCQHLKQLKILHLASTELTDIQDNDLSFNSLTDLDMSLNEFTSIGLKKAVEKLNACKLMKINLAFCGASVNLNNECSNNLIDSLTKVLNAGSCTNLEEIDLSGCNLSDVDCWRLIQAVSRSKVLRLISLKQNTLLTKVTWKFLLENLTVKYLYLEGCTLLLNDFTNVDSEHLSITNCCENIFVSLANGNNKCAQLDILNRFWNSASRCSGKIFKQNLRVLMTLKPDGVSSDEWDYCLS